MKLIINDNNIEMQGTQDELYDGWLSLTRELCKVLTEHSKTEITLERFLETSLEAVKLYGDGEQYESKNTK